MKRTNLSGIFATVFVAATVITLASCSQDDEYYEDGLFTRADEMMTRSGGDPGGEPQINNSGFDENECGVWCLTQLFGNLSGIRRIINENQINMEDGLQQSDMIRISDSLGFGLSGFMNDTYMIGDSIVTEQGRAVRELIRLKGTNLANVIICTSGHCSVGLKIKQEKKVIEVMDVNPAITQYSFNDVTGFVW